MSQALYTDERSGSEIREADEGTYQVVNGDGKEVALVQPEEADEIATLLTELTDPDVQVEGRPGPEGDGWKLGQMTHPLLGIPTGIVFFDPDLDGAEQRETAAQFHGGIEVAEDFIEVFGSA